MMIWKIRSLRYISWNCEKILKVKHAKVCNYNKILLNKKDSLFSCFTTFVIGMRRRFYYWKPVINLNMVMHNEMRYFKRKYLDKSRTPLFRAATCYVHHKLLWIFMRNLVSETYSNKYEINLKFCCLLPQSQLTKNLSPNILW